MPFVSPAHDEAMNESRVIAGEIRPKELILELKADRTGGIAVDLGDEELSRCDLANHAARIQLALVPHDHTKRVDPSRRFFEHVLDGRGIRWQCLTDGHRSHCRTPPSMTVSDGDDRSRTLSSVNTTRPNQTNPKPVSCVRVNGS